MNNQPPINDSMGVTKESLAMKEKSLAQIAHEAFLGHEVPVTASIEGWRQAAQAVADHVRQFELHAECGKAAKHLQDVITQLKTELEIVTDNCERLQECNKSLTKQLTEATLKVRELTDNCKYLIEENIKLKADYESLTYDNIALTAKLRECTESFTMLENSNLLLHEEIKKLNQQHPATKFKVGDDAFVVHEDVQSLYRRKIKEVKVTYLLDRQETSCYENELLTKSEASDWVMKGGKS